MGCYRSKARGGLLCTHLCRHSPEMNPTRHRLSSCYPLWLRQACGCSSFPLKRVANNAPMALFIRQTKLAERMDCVADWLTTKYMAHEAPGRAITSLRPVRNANNLLPALLNLRTTQTAPMTASSVIRKARRCACRA